MRRFTYLFVVVLAAAGLAAYFVPDWMNAPAEQGYRLGRVDRGEIVASVNATGAINPTTTVIVGSQLSGQVVEILVDFNSEVKAGQVVARLNSDQIRAKLDAARADLEQMQATRMVQEGQILRAQADIEKARAARTDMEAQVARNASLLEEAERNFSRQSDLRQRQISAEATFDTSRTQRDAQRSALASARAQLLSSEASIKSLDADLQIAQAQLKAVTAQVAQREAAVRQIEVDIRNSEIKSPVNGVIVQRNVELGQTVAASLQAPTLFLIADDLHRMEISASIDEADVGRIKPGQKASFTVNAFPGRTFEGEVKLVRLGSQTVQNVVIYTAIIAIDNPRLELLPGMTANLRVETDRREDVLRLPNAALRFRPAGAAPDAAPLAGAPEGARGGGGQQGGRSREFANAVRSELKLSADQTNEVDAAFAEMRTMFAGAAESDPASRREQFRAARRALEERIAALLTPEQKTQFDAIRARFDESPNRGQSGRIYVLGSDNKPQAVNVRLGASDGGQTEIVTGDIKAGQDVIIGGGPRAPETRPTGPRFGF